MARIVDGDRNTHIFQSAERSEVVGCDHRSPQRGEKTAYVRWIVVIDIGPAYRPTRAVNVVGDALRPAQCRSQIVHRWGIALDPKAMYHAAAPHFRISHDLTRFVNGLRP